MHVILLLAVIIAILWAFGPRIFLGLLVGGFILYWSVIIGAGLIMGLPSHTQPALSVSQAEPAPWEQTRELNESSPEIVWLKGPGQKWVDFMTDAFDANPGMIKCLDNQTLVKKWVYESCKKFNH